MRQLASEADTLALGAELAGGWGGRPWSDELILLRGELGAGKTTLVRGFLRTLGHNGTVKSPTYTLVEPYQLDVLMVYHFDFYRITDARELGYMGIDDLMREAAVKLVEWPEQAGDKLPEPQLEIQFTVQGTMRIAEIRDHRDAPNDDPSTNA